MEFYTNLRIKLACKVNPHVQGEKLMVVKFFFFFNEHNGSELKLSSHVSDIINLDIQTYPSNISCMFIIHS